MLGWPGLLACGGSLLTDDGQLEVELAKARQVTDGEGVPNAVAVGTALCPALRTTEVSGPEAGMSADDCYTMSATGGSIVDGCAVADTPGELVWRFERIPCALDDRGFLGADDQVSLRVVSSEEVTAEAWDVVAWIEGGALAPGDGSDAWPTGWGQPEGEPYQILDGSAMWFRPGLWTAAGEAGVLWAPTSSVLWADVGSYDLITDEKLRIEGVDGQHATGWVAVADHGAWPFVETVGVPEDAPHSLEVVTAIEIDEDGTSAPVGARAVVRDRAGKLVWGVPVTWSVDGEPLKVSDESWVGAPPGPDLVWLDDVCVPPHLRAGPRESTVTASWRGKQASAVLRWTGAVAEVDANFTADPKCVWGGGGCGCSPTGGPGSSLVAGLVALVALRRRAS